MEILKFDGGKPSKNRNKLVTVIAGAFLVAVVGSTFAANITINTNNSLEYGQGLTQAAACDPLLTVTPTNFFVNSGGAGSFYIDTITVVDSRTANSAGLALCAGKSIKLSAYSNTAGTPLFSCTFGNITWSSPTLGATVTTCPSGAAITNYSSGSDKGLQLAFSAPQTNPAVLAGDVYKITVESF